METQQTMEWRRKKKENETQRETRRNVTFKRKHIGDQSERDLGCCQGRSAFTPATPVCVFSFACERPLLFVQFFHYFFRSLSLRRGNPIAAQGQHDENIPE